LGPYHNEVHATLGRPPVAAWAEGLAGIHLRHPADPDSLWRDFLPFEERLVRRDGIRLFGIQYQDGALAHLVGTTAKLRVKYDPRDLNAVFVELPTGGDVRVPYADFSRPAITLWEHREARRKLRAEGRRQVDEHAMFAAIAEQRRVLAAAYEKSKAARRAVSRARSVPVRIAAMEHFYRYGRYSETSVCRGGRIVDGQPDGGGRGDRPGERRPNNRHPKPRFITIQGSFYRDPGAGLSRSRVSNGAWHGLPASILTILAPRHVTTPKVVELRTILRS
jgi:hypothetical protein